MFPEQPVWNKEISIHALREEGDPKKLCRKEKLKSISIHALREEGDPCLSRGSKTR